MKIKRDIESVEFQGKINVLWSKRSCSEHRFKKHIIFGKEIFVCFYGRIFDVEFDDKKIVELFLKKKYEELVYIGGSFSFLLIHEDNMYAYTGNAYANPFYTYMNKDKIYISDDFEAIAKKIKIVPTNQRIAALCWGANCLPYDDFQILETNSVYQVYKEMVLNWKHRIPDRKHSRRFEDICAEAKLHIENAVASCLTGDKIALALSGGVDSSVLAICLKKLGADFECFHWTSDEFSPIDERQYARELCDRYDIKLNLIDIGEGIRNNNGYVNPNFEYYFPYNHGSFYWWERTVKAAVAKGCKVLFSGLNGDGLFSAPFSLIQFKDIFGENSIWKMKFWWNSFGLPDRNLFLTDNDKTKRSIFEYLFLRRAEFISENYLQGISKCNKEEVFIQRESLRMNLFSRYGIECINPYLDQKLIEYCSGIPKYFKSIPVSGIIVQKPVLKKAFKDELPFAIYARNSKSNFGILSQKFCYFNRNYIYNCLYKESELKSKGIIIEKKFIDVLKDEKKLNQNAYSLIRSCFIEYWLQQRKDDKYV